MFSYIALDIIGNKHKAILLIEQTSLPGIEHGLGGSSLISLYYNPRQSVASVSYAFYSQEKTTYRVIPNNV